MGRMRTYTSYRQFRSSRVYRYITGSPLGQKKAKGYCWCDTHRGFLSEALIKQHRCRKRQCGFFEEFRSE